MVKDACLFLLAARSLELQSLGDSPTTGHLNNYNWKQAKQATKK
jgi:hypothetical protein